MPDSIRDSRPFFLIDGEERADLKQRLLKLHVVESQGGVYRCEATFANWGEKDGAIGFLYYDRRVLEFGKTLVVRYDDRTLFEGRIGALEGNFPEGAAPQIVVLAEDRLQDLRMKRRTRSFIDRSDADLFRDIAREHGLQPDVDVEGPSHRTQAQVNQSDLAFLCERARAADAELWIEGRNLFVKTRARRSKASVKLSYGSGLRSFRVLADLAHQRSRVQVSGYEPANKRALLGTATDDTVRGEVGTDDSGASILRAKLGERSELLAHAGAASEREAKARAEAFFRHCARRFLRGEGVASPDPQLRAGARVELDGLGALFNGKYQVVETHWLFDEQGLRVEFGVERPGLGKA